MDANATQLPSSQGRSWCCRALVVQIGEHLECVECGAAQACDTLGKTATHARPADPMPVGELEYLKRIFKEAA